MNIKSALRDWLSVSYGIIRILVIGSLRSPPPIQLCRTSPYAGGRINRSMLSCRDMAPLLSTHSPTAPRGEGGAVRHQRGMHFQRPPERLYGFRRQRRHKKWRPKGRSPRQRSDTIYLPRAEPSTRPGGVSRSRTEPLAPRAKGPAAPSTLTPVRACQPSGIQPSAPLTAASRQRTADSGHPVISPAAVPSVPAGKLPLSLYLPAWCGSSRR